MNTFDIEECTEQELERVGGGALFDLKIANGDIASLTLFNSAVASVSVLNLLNITALNSALVDVGPGILTVPYP